MNSEWGRVCVKCGEWKPYSEYDFAPSADGLKKRCRECVKKDKREGYRPARYESWEARRASENLHAKIVDGLRNNRGMNWDNWGLVWEIDHIIPRAAFSFTSLDDPKVRECWAFSNVRPVWKLVNHSKSSLYNESGRPAL